MNQQKHQLTKEYEALLSLYKGIHQSAIQMQHLFSEADFSDSEAIDRLNKLLTFRQDQMQEIEKYHRTIVKFQPHLEKNVLFQLSSHSERIDEIKTSLQSLLQEIASLDALNQTSMKSVITSLKKEAVVLQKEKTAHLAYLPTRKQYTGFFIDKKHY